MRNVERFKHKHKLSYVEYGERYEYRNKRKHDRSTRHASIDV